MSIIATLGMNGLDKAVELRNMKLGHMFILESCVSPTGFISRNDFIVNI